MKRRWIVPGYSVYDISDLKRTRRAALRACPAGVAPMLAVMRLEGFGDGVTGWVRCSTS